MLFRSTDGLRGALNTFLGEKGSQSGTPFVIGVAGSVAVGKSTVARLLQALLSRWPEHPRVELVTTDGFLLPTKDLSDGPQTLDITVAHDGIREILTGKVALPKSVFGSGMLDSSHKQMLWWVLNIGIVLVAVLAFSNRKPKQDTEEKEEDDKE